MPPPRKFIFDDVYAEDFFHQNAKPGGAAEYQCLLCHTDFPRLPQNIRKHATACYNKYKSDFPQKLITIKEKRNQKVPILEGSGQFYKLTFDTPVNIVLEYKSNIDSSVILTTKHTRIKSIDFSKLGCPKFIPYFQPQPLTPSNSPYFASSSPNASSASILSPITSKENILSPVVFSSPITPNNSVNPRKRHLTQNAFHIDSKKIKLFSSPFSTTSTTSTASVQSPTTFSTPGSINPTDIVQSATKLRINYKFSSKKKKSQLEPVNRNLQSHFAEQSKNDKCSQPTPQRPTIVPTTLQSSPTTPEVRTKQRTSNDVFVISKCGKEAICKLCINEVRGVNNFSKHKGTDMHQKNLKLYDKNPHHYPLVDNPQYDFDTFKSIVLQTKLQECVLTCNMFSSGLPFRSMQSLSKYIRKVLLNRNFHCSSDKSANICRNLLGPFAYKSMLDEFVNEAERIALHWDTSTLHNTKILILLVKYWLPGRGVKVRCLAVRSIIGETSKELVDIIKNEFKYIAKLRKVNLHRLKQKITALVADNTNSSFGGMYHEGENNVANRLAKWLGGPGRSRRDCIQIGCLAHIGNNAVKCTTKEILSSFDIATAINKTFGNFNQQPKKRDDLLECWTSPPLKKDPITMKYPLSYVVTRWLSLRPGALRLKRLFPALARYYGKKFSENPDKLSDDESWLYDFYCGADSKLNSALIDAFILFTGEISSPLKPLQSEAATIMSGLHFLNKSKKHVESLAKVDSELKQCDLAETPYASLTKELTSAQNVTFRESLNSMFCACLEYLNKWTQTHEYMERFMWASLTKEVKLGDILRTTASLNAGDRKMFSTTETSIDEDAIFKETETLNFYINEFKGEWKKKQKTTVDRWDQIYLKAQKDGKDLKNIINVAQIILCLSPTNSVAERAYSEIGHIWTDEKSKLSFNTLWAFVMFRWNINAPNFVEFCEQNPDLVEQSTKKEKYKKASYWVQPSAWASKLKCIKKIPNRQKN